VHATPADSPSIDEIERAMNAFAHERNGGLIVLPSPIIHLHREAIAALAVRYRLPTACAFRFYTASGGLLSYGTDPTDQARQAAGYVDRTEGRATRGSADSATDQVRSGDQHEDSEGARPHHPTHSLTRADELIE
jgi:hypothetical protein